MTLNHVAHNEVPTHIPYCISPGRVTGVAVGYVRPGLSKTKQIIIKLAIGSRYIGTGVSTDARVA